MEVANTVIPIPASDKAICTYGGVILVNVSASNASAPANDLVFYDNASAASGTIIGVVPKAGPNQTFPILNTASKGIYVSGTTGWTGSIGLSS